MNQKKLTQIYSEESGKMLAYIRKHLSRQIDVYDEMDILHETFYSLLKSIGLAEPIDNLDAYIYQSIRNKMTDLFRKRQLDKDDMVSPEEIAIDALINEHLEKEEEMEEVYQALQQLPEHQRDIFIKTEVEEKTFKEVSHETGISINTLLSQKRYAVKKLQKILSD